MASSTYPGEPKIHHVNMPMKIRSTHSTATFTTV